MVSHNIRENKIFIQKIKIKNWKSCSTNLYLNQKIIGLLPHLYTIHILYLYVNKIFNSLWKYEENHFKVKYKSNIMEMENHQIRKMLYISFFYNFQYIFWKFHFIWQESTQTNINNIWTVTILQQIMKNRKKNRDKKENKPLTEGKYFRFFWNRKAQTWIRIPLRKMFINHFLILPHLLYMDEDTMRIRKCIFCVDMYQFFYFLRLWERWNYLKKILIANS